MLRNWKYALKTVHLDICTKWTMEHLPLAHRPNENFSPFGRQMTPEFWIYLNWKSSIGWRWLARSSSFIELMRSHTSVNHWNRFHSEALPHRQHRIGLQWSECVVWVDLQIDWKTNDALNWHLHSHQLVIFTSINCVIVLHISQIEQFHCIWLFDGSGYFVHRSCINSDVQHSFELTWVWTFFSGADI